MAQENPRSEEEKKFVEDMVRATSPLTRTREEQAFGMSNAIRKLVEETVRKCIAEIAKNEVRKCVHEMVEAADEREEENG